MKNILPILRKVALFEGISLLVVLFITMPLKYAMDIKEPNLIVGMLHGILFIVYCLLVILVAYQLKWKILTIFLALIASVIPFGTFVADKKIFIPNATN